METQQQIFATGMWQCLCAAAMSLCSCSRASDRGHTAVFRFQTKTHIFLSYMRCCSRPKRFVWDLSGLLGWELSSPQKACCGVRLTRFNTLRMSSMHALASGPPMTPKAHKQLACCLWLKLCRHGTLAQVTVKPCEHS